MKTTKILGLALSLIFLSSANSIAKGHKLSQSILEELSTSLIAHDGSKATEDFTKCKYIMYVFGTSRRKSTKPFVTKVTTFYKIHKAQYKLGAVYIGSETSKNALMGFISSMSLPLKSLQFSKKRLRKRLKKVLRAAKIPSMVIVDEKGNLVLTSSAHKHKTKKSVTNSKILQRFAEVLDPSLKPAEVITVKEEVQPKKQVVGEYDLVKLLGEKVYDKEGTASDYTPFENKYNVVYCSAHWCGYCRRFTPKLVEAFNSNMKDRKIGVTFLSSDHSEKAMRNYMKEADMPWHSTDFDKAKVKAFSMKLKVTMLPALLVFDSSGNLIKSTTKNQSRASILQWLQNEATK